MIDFIPSGARSAPAYFRNRDPIRDALNPRLPQSGLVLEIASGTGEHAVYNAAAFPNLQWQPSDADADALKSISVWGVHSGLPNLRPPVKLDAARPDSWSIDHADVVMNANMIHISPWSTTEGLMKGAGRVLPAGGMMFLYGPYLESTVETAPSNVAFDRSLKQRNPDWGLRRLEEVRALAEQNGLAFAERIPMPANNLMLVFRKS
jgi:hypothetical protein